MDAICEKELIASCITGEREAWNNLIEKYSGIVYMVINDFQLTGQENSDIYQQIFFELYKDNCRKLSTFQGRCSFSTWLAVVTRRICLNYIRSRKEKLYLIDCGEENLLEKENHFENVEDRILVENLLEKLSSEERIIIKLYYMKELSSKEISEITGISENTIYSKIHRALHKMKILYK